MAKCIDCNADLSLWKRLFESTEGRCRSCADLAVLRDRGRANDLMQQWLAELRPATAWSASGLGIWELPDTAQSELDPALWLNRVVLGGIAELMSGGTVVVGVFGIADDEKLYMMTLWQGSSIGSREVVRAKPADERKPVTIPLRQINTVAMDDNIAWVRDRAGKYMLTIRFPKSDFIPENTNFPYQLQDACVAHKPV